MTNGRDCRIPKAAGKMDVCSLLYILTRVEFSFVRFNLAVENNFLGLYIGNISKGSLRRICNSSAGLSWLSIGPQRSGPGERSLSA